MVKVEECSGCMREKLEELKRLITRSVKAFGWMVEDMKWRHNETRRNFEEGSDGGYSPELSEAINALEELRKQE